MLDQILNDPAQTTRFRAAILFAEEREQSRLRRLAGHPWPWSTWPELQRYRFCYPNRSHDAGTRRWLEVDWPALKYAAPRLPLLHKAILGAVVTRLLNRKELFQRLAVKLGLGLPLPTEPSVATWGLEFLQDPGPKHCRAYRIGWGYPDAGRDADLTAINTFLDVIPNLQGLAGSWLNAPSPSAFATALTDLKLPGVGPFVTNEVIHDLRDAGLGSHLNWSTYAFSGPGARGGMHYVLTGKIIGYTASGVNSSRRLDMRPVHDLAIETAARSAELFDHLGLSATAVVQAGPETTRWWDDALCEYSKLVRIQAGLGSGMRRYPQPDRSP